MRLFGPLQPIEVPRPPFSFTTTSLFRIDVRSFMELGSVRSLYDLTCENINQDISLAFKSVYYFTFPGCYLKTS